MELWFGFIFATAIGAMPKMDTQLNETRTELTESITKSKEDLTKVIDEVSKVRSQKEDLEKEALSLKDKLNQTNTSIESLEKELK
ncbi:hypothetical protein [Clostridium sp. B9]|uniref:hypothetical protein n=1 Tax=Clostridium sp. B9 TaxID=3423224 RepID=UPI003D2EAE8F